MFYNDIINSYKKFSLFFRIFVDIFSDLDDIINVNSVLRQSEKTQAMAGVCPSVRTATFYLDRLFTPPATFL